MASPSQKGLLAATMPGAPQFLDPQGNEGTPGGPVMSPQWSAFFDAVNKAAPGGITSKAGLPGQAAEPTFGGISDPYSPTYNSAIDPRLHPDLIANAKLASKGK
jgi:hypothetical protein